MADDVDQVSVFGGTCSTAASALSARALFGFVYQGSLLQAHGEVSYHAASFRVVKAFHFASGPEILFEILQKTSCSSLSSLPFS